MAKKKKKKKVVKKKVVKKAPPKKTSSKSTPKPSSVGGGLRIVNGQFVDSSGTYDSSGRRTSGGSSSPSSSGASYADLRNDNGTIVNDRTGKRYSTPDELARDLGTSASGIRWGDIGNKSQAPSQAGDALQTIADIYSKRSDLQSFYGSDGRAINPNDPRIQGLPTILDWAEQYGSKEYSTLNGYKKNAPQMPEDGEYAEGEFPTTGDPNLDAILSEMQKRIDAAQAAGQMINPRIELTPAEVKKFLDQATDEIDPYYAEQVKMIRADLDRNLDELNQSYEQTKEQYQADFQKNLGSKRESLADTGLAFSGVRGQQEKSLVDDQNRELEATALTASSRAKKVIADTESRIGSRNLGSLLMPNLTEFQATNEGLGGFKSRRTLDFAADGNITGDVEYNKNRDIRSLSDYLQAQEVTRRTLNF